MTEATIRTHLTRIYEKVGVRGRIELLASLVEPGLAPLEPGLAPLEPDLAPLEPDLAPVVLAADPSVSALEQRAALSDYVRTCVYVGGLLAADGLLVHLTPLSALLGPTLLAAHVVSARSGVASRRVQLAVLTAGILLSTEQIAVLVALRTL